MQRYIVLVRRIAILKTAGFIISLMMFSGEVLAVDPTEFLGFHRLKHVAQLSAGHIGQDHFGNRFQLEEVQEPGDLQKLVFSLFIDLMELPNVSKFPILVPEGKIKKDFKRMIVNAEAVAERPSGRIPDSTAINFIKHTILSYLFGVSVASSDFGFVNEQFVRLQWPREFYLYKDSLSERFSKLGIDLGRLSVDDQTTILKFINKLRNISSENWGRLSRSFGAAFNLEFVQKRLQALSESDWPKKMISAVDQPKVLVPVSSIEQMSPIVFLWNFYFKLDQKKSVDFDQVYLRAEKELPEIYGLYSSHILDQETPNHLLPQVNLSAMNSTTLVVVPINDLEAEEIRLIAKMLKVDLLAVNYPHGGKLDKPLMKQIDEELAKKNYRRIIIVELPEKELGFEEQLRQKFQSLLIVDHHDYDGQKRYQPISSLEQVAMILGYRLSNRERTVAVADAKFVSGLLDFETPRSMVPSFLASWNSRIPRMETLQSKFGQIRFYTQWENIGTVASALTLESYPKIPNVLNVSSTAIRFSGEARIVEALKNEFEAARKDIPGDWLAFSGGDLYRSAFFGIKKISVSAEPLLLERLSTILEVPVESLRVKPEESEPCTPSLKDLGSRFLRWAGGLTGKK